MRSPRPPESVLSPESKEEVEARLLRAESELLWFAGARSSAYETCFFTYEPILSMSSLATGKTAFILSSGLMMRPSLSFLALMYFQIAFVTSTLLSFFAPQIAAKASLRVFGAKRRIFFAFSDLMAFFEPALRLRRTCA